MPEEIVRIVTLFDLLHSRPILAEARHGARGRFMSSEELWLHISILQAEGEECMLTLGNGPPISTGFNVCLIHWNSVQLRGTNTTELADLPLRRLRHSGRRPIPFPTDVTRQQ